MAEVWSRTGRLAGGERFWRCIRGSAGEQDGVVGGVGRRVFAADIMLLGAFNQAFLVNPAETASDIASETQGGRVWFKG